MNNYDYILTSDGHLYHHGIKGMKWGVRRYRNEDGSLTPAGKKRAAKNQAYRDKLVGKADNKISKYTREANASSAAVKDLRKYGKDSETYRQWKKEQDAEREWEYERKNKLEGPNGDTYVKRYAYSGTKLMDDLFDAIGAETTVRNLIDEHTENAAYNTERAKKWTATKSNLMNMNVNDLTKKRDIRRTYRS